MFGFEQLFEGLSGGQFHSSGGHFHGHGGGDSDEEEADTTKYYEVLGVAKSSDDSTIKKAYRKVRSRPCMCHVWIVSPCPLLAPTRCLCDTCAPAPFPCPLEKGRLNPLMPKGLA